MVVPILIALVRIVLLIIQIITRILILIIRMTIQTAKVVGTQLMRLTSKALGYASKKMPELAEYAVKTGEQAAKNAAKYRWESTKSWPGQDTTVSKSRQNRSSWT